MIRCIHQGTVLTMDEERTIVRDGAVVIEGSEIIAVGPAEIAADYDVEEWIDAKGGLILPGFVNGHTHISMSPFRSLGEDIPDRLRRYLFPLEDQLVDEGLVRAGARLSLCEMALSGVTTFCDMYYFEEEVAKETKAFGMRAVLGETILDKPSPDSRTPYGGIAYAEDFISRWKGDRLITPALAPHATYTNDREHLLAIRAISDQMEVPMLMHVSEALFEMEQFAEEHGMTPVEYLEEIGFLSPRLVAVHLVYATENDIELLKKHDIGVVHNVVANAKSGRKVAPALAMLSRGIRLGLGTDGPMSGNHQDILGILGYYTKIHKLDTLDRSVCSALEAVELGTIGGARALKMEDRIGSLEAGKKADIIIMETRSPNMLPVHDPYSAIVYSAYPHNVVMTMVDGQVIMRDRVLLTIDYDSVIREIEGYSHEIAEFAADLDRELEKKQKDEKV